MKAQIVWSEDPELVAVVCDLAIRFGCSVREIVDHLSAFRNKLRIRRMHDEMRLVR